MSGLNDNDCMQLKLPSSCTEASSFGDVSSEKLDEIIALVLNNHTGGF